MAYVLRLSLGKAAMVLLTIVCVAFGSWQIYDFVRGPQLPRADASDQPRFDRNEPGPGMPPEGQEEPPENSRPGPRQNR